MSVERNKGKKAVFAKIASRRQVLRKQEAGNVKQQAR